MYIVIKRDLDPYNPREDDCNLSMLAMKSRFSHIGEHSIHDKDVFLEQMVENENPEFIEGLEYAASELMETEDNFLVESRWAERRNRAIADEFDRLFIHLPVYAYEHSALALSTRGFTCSWDSGQVGIIFVSRTKAQEEMGSNTYPLEISGDVFKTMEDHVQTILEHEVKTMHQYINGEVYGFQLYNDEDEEVDSCWGFYSDDFGEDWESNGMAEHWAEPARTYAAVYIDRDYGEPYELLREAKDTTLDPTA